VLVLGLDPSTKSTGYGIINVLGSVHAYVECGVLTARASAPLQERQQEILAGLREVLEEHRPDIVGIETQFANPKFPLSGIKVAAIRGQLTAVCTMACLTVHEFSPANVKRIVAGRGQSSKRQVQDAVKLRLGLHKLPQTDAADALAIAITLAAKLRQQRRAA